MVCHTSMRKKQTKQVHTKIAHYKKEIIMRKVKGLSYLGSYCDKLQNKMKLSSQRNFKIKNTENFKIILL